MPIEALDRPTYTNTTSEAFAPDIALADHTVTNASIRAHHSLVGALRSNLATTAIGVLLASNVFTSPLAAPIAPIMGSPTVPGTAQNFNLTVPGRPERRVLSLAEARRIAARASATAQQRRLQLADREAARSAYLDASDDMDV
jgi:hypothetical protein